MFFFVVLLVLALSLLPGARRHNLHDIALNTIKSFIAKKPISINGNEKKSM